MQLLPIKRNISNVFITSLLKKKQELLKSGILKIAVMSGDLKKGKSIIQLFTPNYGKTVVFT
ncbi:hypothetical protein D3C75_1336160 [compost metagenome]